MANWKRKHLTLEKTKTFVLDMLYLKFLRKKSTWDVKQTVGI